MDLKNINTAQLRNHLQTFGKTVAAYRFFIVSLAVLVLLSIVIIDVGAINNIAADKSKIESDEGNQAVTSIDDSVLAEIQRRIEHTNQSTTHISTKNPFVID